MNRVTFSPSVPSSEFIYIHIHVWQTLNHMNHSKISVCTTLRTIQCKTTKKPKIDFFIEQFFFGLSGTAVCHDIDNHTHTHTDNLHCHGSIRSSSLFIEYGTMVLRKAFRFFKPLSSFITFKSFHG